MTLIAFYFVCMAPRNVCIVKLTVDENEKEKSYTRRPEKAEN